MTAKNRIRIVLLCAWLAFVWAGPGVAGKEVIHGGTDVIGDVNATRQRLAVNVQTLNATLVLTTSSSGVQWIDPGGASRNMTLSPEENSTGLSFVIINAADAAETLTVRTDANATVLTIDQNETGQAWCNGTTWRGMVAGNT